ETCLADWIPAPRTNDRAIWWETQTSPRSEHIPLPSQQMNLVLVAALNIDNFSTFGFCTEPFQVYAERRALIFAQNVLQRVVLAVDRFTSANSNQVAAKLLFTLRRLARQPV